MTQPLHEMTEGDVADLSRMVAEIKSLSEILCAREQGSSHAFQIYKRARDALEILTFDRIQRDVLTKLSSGHETFQGHVVSATVLHHMKMNQKINAIKEFRGETGLGLKEAKDWVEAYMVKHNMGAPSW